MQSVAHERLWLERLGPRLSVAAPVPLEQGAPGEGFTWPWSVHRWLDGRNAVAGALERPEALAAALGAFVAGLRRVDARDGPPRHRGVPLAERDAPTRSAIARSAGRIDTAAVTALWEEALRAPGRTAPPAWAHGDLPPGNVLVADGRLAAVIDFGSVGAGDPAVDLIVARNLLPAPARATFRAAVGADDAEWARGRGWALSISLIQLPFHWETDPPPAENSRHVIKEILAGAGGRRVRGRRMRGPGPEGDGPRAGGPRPPAPGGYGPTVEGLPDRPPEARPLPTAPCSPTPPSPPRRPSAGRRCRACPWRAWPWWRGRPSPGPGR
ncbi:aminoglycoside phosphotransferase family protein [Streptomyces sp. NPDC088766]|uniref:aminoglycoside phosphotransferase family protein n=1 Tax=Streptomyces sp. NPDC088766 TaxID=3365893 RepID=UPI0037F51B3D